MKLGSQSKPATLLPLIYPARRIAMYICKVVGQFDLYNLLNFENYVK